MLLPPASNSSMLADEGPTTYVASGVTRVPFHEFAMRSGNREQEDSLSHWDPRSDLICQLTRGGETPNPEGVV